MKIGDLISIRYVYAGISIFIISSLTFAILRSIFDKNWLVLFTAIMVLFLSSIPIFVKKRTQIQIPIELQFIILVFIYATLFLGEIHGYYNKYFWWDDILHFGSAIVFGLIGFTILCIMYSKEKIKAKPIVIATFSFFFAVGIGAIWEIFEFSMDQFFGFNMQKSGLMDTMSDLIMDTLGALIASIFGFFYLKKKKTFLFKNTDTKKLINTN